MTTIVTSGKIRKLTRDEKKNTSYKWAVLTPFRYEHTDYDENDNIHEIFAIEVPEGFLTDGASGGGPDYGSSWIFHDWLYATHEFSVGQSCTRKQADIIMYDVLKNERLDLYAIFFKFLSRFNPFWTFSRAWKKSGRRGAEYLND